MLIQGHIGWELYREHEALSVPRATRALAGAVWSRCATRGSDPLGKPPPTTYEAAGPAAPAPRRCGWSNRRQFSGLTPSWPSPSGSQPCTQRPPATRTMPPRRPASSTSTRSPTARSYPRTANPKSSYSWTSSARSTSSPILDGNGPSAADGTRTPTGSRGPVGGRPTPGRTGPGTCSPPTTWPRTSSTATSNRRRTGRGSFSSAAVCAASTRRTSGSPSCSRSARSVAIPEAAPESPGRTGGGTLVGPTPGSRGIGGVSVPGPHGCAHQAGRGSMKRAGAQPASGVTPCSLPAGGEGSSRAVSRSL